MAHINLDAVQSALVAARMEAENRHAQDMARFERYAQRKLDRMKRERSINRAKLEGALARSLGMQSLPPTAGIGVGDDGVAFVNWPDPPAPPKPAQPASETTPPDAERKHEGAITPMPTNGAAVGAS